jgi:hypothetical protein
MVVYRRVISGRDVARANFVASAREALDDAHADKTAPTNDANAKATRHVVLHG